MFTNPISGSGGYLLPDKDFLVSAHAALGSLSAPVSRGSINPESARDHTVEVHFRLSLRRSFSSRRTRGTTDRPGKTALVKHRNRRIRLVPGTSGKTGQGTLQGPQTLGRSNGTYNFGGLVNKINGGQSTRASEGIGGHGARRAWGRVVSTMDRGSGSDNNLKVGSDEKREWRESPQNTHSVATNNTLKGCNRSPAGNASIVTWDDIRTCMRQKNKSKSAPPFSNSCSGN